MYNNDVWEEIREKVAYEVMDNFVDGYLNRFGLRKKDAVYLGLNNNGRMSYSTKEFKLDFTIEINGKPLIFKGNKVIAKCIYNEKEGVLTVNYQFE